MENKLPNHQRTENKTGKMEITILSNKPQSDDQAINEQESLIFELMTY